MRFKKVRDVQSPTRAHEHDAGIDFFVPYDFAPEELEPTCRINVPSGIKVEVPKGYALIAFNKSGVATRTGLVAGACVVDSGYEGEVHLSLINTSCDDVLIEPGQKILQFILMPVGLEMLEESETLFDVSHSDRGSSGFGSTG